MRVFARMMGVAGVFLLASAALAQSVGTAPKMDQVLAYGPGVWRIDAESGESEAWIGCDRVVTDVCCLSSMTDDVNTVCVLCDGAVRRLRADSGRDVALLPNSPGEPTRPVNSGQVLKIAGWASLATIELARSLSGWKDVSPRCCSYHVAATWRDDLTFGMEPQDTFALDSAPDRLWMSYAERDYGPVFVWTPLDGPTLLRVESQDGLLATLTRAAAGEGYTVLDAAMPSEVQTIFVLLGDADGRLCLGMANRTLAPPDVWNIRPLAFPSVNGRAQLTVTHDGGRLLIATGSVVHILDPVSLSTQMTLDATPAAGGPVIVLETCLLWGPVPTAAGAPPASSPPAFTRRAKPRQATLIAALCGSTDSPTTRQLVIWNLGTGAHVRTIGLWPGITHITPLSMVTSNG